MKHKMLSTKSLDVLQFISEGCSYDQILSKHDGLTYFDIFNAAHEALTIANGGDASYDVRMADIRSAHPRAYEKWSAEEEKRLIQMVHSNLSISEIASRLQRQTGAIRSRMLRLNLIDDQASQ